MKKFSSIQKKLIKANILTLVIAFSVVGAILVDSIFKINRTMHHINDEYSQVMGSTIEKIHKRNTAKLQNFFEESVRKKGKFLLQRDRASLLQFFLEEEIDSLREILNNTFYIDEEILNVSFFAVEEEELSCLAYWSKFYSRGLNNGASYSFETQKWTGVYVDKAVEVSDKRVMDIIKIGKMNIQIIDHLLVNSAGEEKNVKALECTVPILDGTPDEFEEFIDDGEQVGFLRYIFSLEKMQDAIEQENRQMEEDLTAQKLSNTETKTNNENLTREIYSKTFNTLLGTAFAVILISFFLARFLSKKISKPIIQLQENASVIAGGNYQQPISSEADDEIGSLAVSFEEMRVKVKAFTEELQQMVDNKTKEISDILNSIEQGIFTVNSDLSINKQHSIKAEDIFGISDFEKAELKSLFKLDEEGLAAFSKWIELISQPRKLKRWNKYAELSPVQEIEMKHESSTSYIDISYRPIIENGVLSKIMVLCKDVTVERQIKAELERSQKENLLTVERIIGLINNTKEALDPFFTYFENSIKTLKTIDVQNCSKEEIDEAFRLMHTLKGNAGSLCFMEVSKIAGTAEDLLEKLKDKNGTSLDLSKEVDDSVESLEREYKAIEDIKATLTQGQGDALSVDRERFEKLLQSLKKGVITDLTHVIDHLELLKCITFQKFCSQYETVFNNYIKENNKEKCILKIKTPDAPLKENLIKILNTPLIHLVRNSLDHGLENDEERITSGKGLGILSLSLEYKAGEIFVEVEDNGRGIDVDKISSAAVAKGLFTEEEVKAFSYEEKLNLIFHPGFSSQETVTEISGRGVGMDAVKKALEDEGGSIKIETEVGRGTKFILTLPIENNI